MSDKKSKKDLWGALPKMENIITPIEILKAQADILGEKTKNGLKGVLISGKGSSELVQATLFMAAPALKFKREILMIKYGMGIYPVYVIDSYAKKPKKCDSEEQFEEAVKKTLKSDRVQLLIKQLLTHVNSIKLIIDNSKEQQIDQPKSSGNNLNDQPDNQLERRLQARREHERRNT